MVETASVQLTYLSRYRVFHPNIIRCFHGEAEPAECTVVRS